MAVSDCLLEVVSVFSQESTRVISSGVLTRILRSYPWQHDIISCVSMFYVWGRRN